MKNILITILALIVCGCERRPLENDITNRAKIPITIYWDLAGIIPQNVTVLIYKENGNLYQEQNFENSGLSVHSELSLEVGKYTVVVFNEKRDQIDYVRIRGQEKLSTLEAYITSVSSAYNTQGKSDGKTIVNEPGSLATATAEIIVSPDMIENTDINSNPSWNALTDIHPILKTVNVDIKAHIKGINNSRMPVLGELVNMAESYLFSTDKNSSIPVAIQFLINGRSYDSNSITDGIIYTSITSFGIPGERVINENTSAINLNLIFQLVDSNRTLITFSQYVNPIMVINENENRSLSILINIDSSDLWRLPDVKPEDSSDSGINSEVVDWDTVEIPIKL